MKKRIVLGSGELYNMNFTGELPKLADICTEANRFSHVKNGASLEYTKEVNVEKDDLGLVQKTKMITEDAVIKIGLMTFSGDTLSKLAETIRVASVSPETGKQLTKIGGLSQEDDSSYVWCFYHKDKKDGDIYLLLAGKNSAGCTIGFKQDGATVIDAEIKAEPCDDEGTLIYYYEEIKQTEASGTDQTVTSGTDKTEASGT